MVITDESRKFFRTENEQKCIERLNGIYSQWSESNLIRILLQQPEYEFSGHRTTAAFVRRIRIFGKLFFFVSWLGGHQGSRLLQIAALKVKLAAKSPKTFSLLLLD